MKILVMNWLLLRITRFSVGIFIRIAYKLSVTMRRLQFPHCNSHFLLFVAFLGNCSNNIIIAYKLLVTMRMRVTHYAYCYFILLITIVFDNCSQKVIIKSSLNKRFHFFKSCLLTKI